MKIRQGVARQHAAVASAGAGAEHVGCGRERYKLGIVIRIPNPETRRVLSRKSRGLAACKTLASPSQSKQALVLCVNSNR